jgi:hypothetical protein
MDRSMRLTRRLEAIPAQLAADTAFLDVATAAGERLEAARLVGRLYRAEGYLEQGAVPDAPFRTPHHALPEATVFVAREAGSVVGTLTAVLDSRAGLPLEALYGGEVTALRDAGRVPCELCSLAVEPRGTSQSAAILQGLFRIATAFIVHFTETTDALITLKPSHRAFYARRLRFHDFGPLRTDPRFRQAETVALRLTREVVEGAASLFGAPTAKELGRLKRTLEHSSSDVP